MNVIINLPSEEDVEGKKLLQDSIDNFIASLIVDTINQLNTDNKTKKEISNEILKVLNEKSETN